MKVSGTSIYMVRGDTEAIEIELENEEGNILLKEGDIIYFTIKESALLEEKILQKRIIDFVDGKALITIYPEDTRDLEFKTYRYDIQWTNEDGSVKTIVPPSKFVIEEEITYE